MNRLTYKNHKIEIAKNRKQFEKDVEIICDKLGKLEDIEEKLGIDLITMFKALKEGIWVKEKTDNNTFVLSHYNGYISNRSYGFVCIEDELISYYEVFMGDLRKEINFYLKDYGKTWALTREELNKYDK